MMCVWGLGGISMAYALSGVKSVKMVAIYQNRERYDIDASHNIVNDVIRETKSS